MKDLTEPYKSNFGLILLQDSQVYKYIDKLEDFVKLYHHYVHRMIGMRPAEVSEKDRDRIMARLNRHNLHRPRKLSVFGKIARISKIKESFEKRCAQLE